MTKSNLELMQAYVTANEELRTAHNKVQYLLPLESTFLKEFNERTEPERGAFLKVRRELLGIC